MVSHIGIALAIGSSPPAPPPMRACARVPAVLSLQDRFLRSYSSWRNGIVRRRAKSPALIALIALTPETSAFRRYASLETPALPQRKLAEASPVSLASYGAKELSCVGVLAVHSRES